MSAANNKFAVLLKPGELQPAIARAAQYAHFEPSIDVTAVRIINEWKDGNEEDVKSRIRGEFELLRRKYPAIKNFNLKIIFDKDVAQGFADECNNGDYVLAVISANKRNTIKDLFISPVDSGIMKKCRVPLLVVNDVNSQSVLGKTVLVAADLEESTRPESLDDKLVNAAKMLAEHFNGEVHIVNCVPFLNRGLMGGDVSLSKIAGSGMPERVDLHHRIVEEFAKKHDINPKCTHVVAGRIDEEIPRISKKLDARMVCMGANPSSSFFGNINSSGCELVLEQIRGDLFIVTAD